MKKHPRKLTCDKCGGKLKVERYSKNGEHFRKYSCPNCKISEVFQKARDGYR